MGSFSARRSQQFVTALVVLLVCLGVLAVVAVACEGTGGPPSSPPEKEQKCNATSPTLELECVGKAVNNATGDETEEQTDTFVAGRGPGLVLKRAYDSFAAAEGKEGPLGIGWSMPYGAKLEVSGEKVLIRQADGSVIEFFKSGSEYTQGGWDQARLTKSTNYVLTLPDQSKEEFNTEGKLVKETDRDGNSNTLGYTSGKLETVTDGAGRKLTFKYNGEGLIESVKDPMGHVASYTYSSKQLASVTLEGKERWKFEYESPHLLTKVTDGRGHVTTVKYEATTHKATEETRGGHTRKWEYKTKETKITEPNGSETLETFNSAGEPTKVTRAKGITGVETTTEYEYNGTSFARTKTIDGLKHETTYGYDEEGNKTSEKDPAGDERKWKYDKKHDVDSETTPEGETTTIKLTASGKPEAVEHPVGEETQKTKYKYAENGDLTEETDPLGNITKYTYDEYGDRATAKDAEGDERKYKYNEDGQLTEETSPRGFATKYELDEQGRRKKITDPLGHTTKYVYDGDGNVESETDGNEHTTKTTFNEEDLPIKVEEPNKTIVETGYDSEGQKTSFTDGNKHVWEYKRNQVEQITEEKNPLLKTWKKKYDKAGNLETLEDPEKHATEYTYDTANRLTKVKYSTGKPSEVKYEYNKDSKVTVMTDETGETKNTWDKLDRLTEAKNGAGKIVKYEYDLANLPTKITYPNEKAVTRSYDKALRLEKLKDWNSKETSFKYDADSQPEKTIFPGTENEDTYAYNEADQLTEIHYKHEATTLGSLVYTRDNDGQVKKTTQTGLPGAETTEAKYDENNRQTEGQGKTYEYDAANNPTKIDSTAGYTYNEADQLEKGPGTSTYTYNEDGQRTKTKPETGPTTTYTYDQAGNLTGIERPEEGITPKIEDSYKYDGSNLRQAQTINGTTTHLTWDTSGALPLVLADETNNYIYGPQGVPVEQISSGGTTLYLHHDQQNSTRLLTSTSGTAETTYSYAAYGRLLASSGTATTPLTYDGQYASTDVGLIYLRARTYDPVTAQFLVVDPALYTGDEAYTYAEVAPETRADLTGLCATGPDKEKECTELKIAEFEARRTSEEFSRLALLRARELQDMWWTELFTLRTSEEINHDRQRLYRLIGGLQNRAFEFSVLARMAEDQREKLGCPGALPLPTPFPHGPWMK